MNMECLCIYCIVFCKAGARDLACDLTLYVYTATEARTGCRQCGPTESWGCGTSYALIRVVQVGGGYGEGLRQPEAGNAKTRGAFSRESCRESLAAVLAVVLQKPMASFTLQAPGSMVAPSTQVILEEPACL